MSEDELRRQRDESLKAMQAFDRRWHGKAMTDEARAEWENLQLDVV